MERRRQVARTGDFNVGELLVSAVPKRSSVLCLSHDVETEFTANSLHSGEIEAVDGGAIIISFRDRP
jgi:hypothetical protein